MYGSQWKVNVCPWLAAGQLGSFAQNGYMWRTVLLPIRYHSYNTVEQEIFACRKISRFSRKSRDSRNFPVAKMSHFSVSFCQLLNFSNRSIIKHFIAMLVQLQYHLFGMNMDLISHDCLHVTNVWRHPRVRASHWGWIAQSVINTSWANQTYACTIVMNVIN